LLQLIAIVKDPIVLGCAVGSELRTFALHLARLDPSVEAVVAVTLARSFADSGKSMQEYVNDHAAGISHDPIIGFHTSSGARVQRLCPGYRPEDTDNEGIGVLIRYEIRGHAVVRQQPPPQESSDEPKQHSSPWSSAAAAAAMDTQALLIGFIRGFGYEVDPQNLEGGFIDYGMDSVELGELREKVCAALGFDFPMQALFDHSNVSELSAFLDVKLAMARLTSPPGQRAPDADDDDCSTDSGEAIDLAWDDLEVRDLVRIHRDFIREYEQPALQQEFKELAEQHFPDRFKYSQVVMRACTKAQGKVLYRLGLIPDVDVSSVKFATGRLHHLVCRHWLTNPELKKVTLEIAELTYRPWPANGNRPLRPPSSGTAAPASPASSSGTAVLAASSGSTASASPAASSGTAASPSSPSQRKTERRSAFLDSASRVR